VDLEVRAQSRKAVPRPRTPCAGPHHLELDEITNDSWRDPDEYLEPLTGGPFSKLRVGQYRLACVLDYDNLVLEVHRIEHRSGAYTADD
jgi:mRNA-degrading endonuclease RelE of RelBE toxin-antitoxin system